MSRDIGDKKTCAMQSVSNCSSTYSSIINSSVSAMLNSSLGDSGLCDNLCSPNPCQNMGTCAEMSPGFNCTCLPGFTGKLCDQGKSCCF